MARPGGRARSPRGDAAARSVLALGAAAAEPARAPIEAARSQRSPGGRSPWPASARGPSKLLRSAERAFDARGAERDRGEARRELRRLGARDEPRGPSGAASGGLESLSRREREVAELVTARMTNREMAAELFLSEKTVESHLRNIFAKLAVSSRVEVARVVERDDAPLSGSRLPVGS